MPKNSRYYYALRPPSIGCQPDGWVDREGGLPKKIWVTREGDSIHSFGWVEYETPLTYTNIWRKDLIPEELVERGFYHIWLLANRDQDEADWMMGDYIKLTTKELEAIQDTDPMADIVLNIRNAGTGEG